MVKIRTAQALDADVVIVGGGPAGAAAAFHLAQGGQKVIIVDQKAFPRDKVCGDFVGPVALIELDRMGVNRVQGYKETNIIRQASLSLNGRRLVTSPIPEVKGVPHYGRVIPRQQLDAWILDAAQSAGATVLKEYRATGYTVDRDGVTVQSAGDKPALRAKMLIAADGSTSVLALQLRGQRPRNSDRILAVRAYFENVQGSDEEADLFFTGSSFPGYYWLFPTGQGHANVGVGMALDTLPATTEHLRDMLLRLIETDKALRNRLSGAKMIGKIASWTLTVYNPRLPTVGDRVALIGDAAGLINSLNGEGIQYALQSGRWVAETVLECAKRREFSVESLSSYDARLRSELGFDMALSSLVVQLIRNRSLNPVWLQALAISSLRARTDPEYATLTGGVLAGVVPASSVLSRKVILGTFEQAVMTLGFNSMRQAIKGPAHLATIGSDAARFAMEFAGTMLASPRASAQWVFGVGVSTFDLAGQIAQQWRSRPA